MNRKPEIWGYYVFLGWELLVIGWFLYDFYSIPLSLFFFMGAAFSASSLYLKKINDNRFVIKTVKRSLILMLCLCFGAGFLSYQITPWRKFSRKPFPVYMALAESCEQLLKQENLLDMTADSYRSLVEAAERSGVKNPYADTPKKPGDRWVWDVDRSNIHFPHEILRYSPFEVGIVRNQVFIKFVTDKPGPFYVDIRHFPNNDNKWVIIQNRVMGGIGVLWEGNLGSKEEAETCLKTLRRWGRDIGDFHGTSALFFGFLIGWLGTRMFFQIIEIFRKKRLGSGSYFNI